MSNVNNRITLEEYLSNLTDERLVEVEFELLRDVSPATGAAHSMIREINKGIDRGIFCINPMTYRKVYLPTLARAIHKEMARRYYNLITTQGGHYVRSNDNGDI